MKLWTINRWLSRVGLLLVVVTDDGDGSTSFRIETVRHWRRMGWWLGDKK